MGPGAEGLIVERTSEACAVPMTACAAEDTSAWQRASLAQIARLLVSPVDWA